MTAVGPDDRLPGVVAQVWTAHLASYFLVHYESGGSLMAIMLSWSGSMARSARVVWRSAATEYKDYSAFLKTLKQNKPDDTFDNMF